MSWSFVGRQTTSNSISGGTSGTVTLPGSVQGGDLIIMSFPNTTGGAATTCSVTGFTAQSNQATRLGNAHDQLWTGYRIAAGTFGSATTDSTFAVTMGATSWGEWDLVVLRSTIGVGVVTYTLTAGSSTYTSTLAPAVLSPVPGGSDLTVFGYGGQNAALSGTEVMSSAPTSLSNWPATCPTISGNGGVVGIGWGTGVTSPGSATVTVGSATLATLDSMDWALGATEAPPATPLGVLPQPGSTRWRRKHHKHQQVLQPSTSPDLTVTAGLATGTGTAADFSAGLIAVLTVNAGLATGTGASAQPGINFTAGLATGTGTAQSPTVTLTVNAGLATGTGGAQQPSTPRTAGLASGTGTAQPPGITLTVNAGLATGTGTAQPPGTGSRTIGLATGTGTAQSPVATVIVNAGLATGLGTAQNATVSSATVVNAGLATGTGTAQSPTVTLTVNAGLATGTGGSQQPVTPRTAGLASGTGIAQPPTVTLAVNAGLATGIGAAQQPSTPRTPGLATGTGTAQSPGITLTVNAGLAHGTGTAQAPAASLTVSAGLATGTGTAQAPGTGKRIIGLATGTGIALNASLPIRTNVDYTGSTLSNPNTLGGTVSVFTLGGTLAVAANTLGGTVTVASNTLGGTVTVATLGGTLAVTSDTLTGTLSVATNTLGGTAVEDKMQEVDIILNEFNDATVTFQVLNNGSPDNITGMTVNALFKKTRGDLDSAGTTKTYSSGGGSPAITINTPSTGNCTLAIPDADVVSPNWSFYRIDVVNGSVTTTAIFGTVTITLL